MFINMRDYESALHVLRFIAQRDAEWYYLSAVANYGAGNKALAYAHAQEACRMDPANEQYASLLRRMEELRSGYTERSESYGRPRARRLSPCAWLCLGTCLCDLFSSLASCGSGCCSGNGYGGY